MDDSQTYDSQEDNLQANPQVKLIKELCNIALTENNALALKSTDDYVLDLFYTVGASRGKSIVELFDMAFLQNEEEALRVMLWARDIREGAGERKLFRDILVHLEEESYSSFKKLVYKIPKIGRWDDMLVVKTDKGFDFVSQEIKSAICFAPNSDTRLLAAKWMPRKGPIAEKLRTYWNMTLKEYRNFLVRNTNVVESKMTAKKWDEICFEMVPSLALLRYTKAFKKRAPENFQAYLNALQSGEKKINTGAIYPYDVIKTALNGDENLAEEAWKNLPNYLTDECTLPVVDVSYSMTANLGKNRNLQLITIAISMGLYIATKQKGVFSNVLMTFSGNPKCINLKNDNRTIKHKYEKILNADKNSNTDVVAVFELIMNTAKRLKIKQDGMPKRIIIFSDMEFDSACHSNGDRDTVFNVCKKMFEDNGYKLPVLVFWNLQSRQDHFPVVSFEEGCILISGFSPYVMKQVLRDDMLNITPRSAMESVIYSERYDIDGNTMEYGEIKNKNGTRVGMTGDGERGNGMTGDGERGNGMTGDEEEGNGMMYDEEGGNGMMYDEEGGNGMMYDEEGGNGMTDDEEEGNGMTGDEEAGDSMMDAEETGYVMVNNEEETEGVMVNNEEETEGVMVNNEEETEGVTGNNEEAARYVMVTNEEEPEYVTASDEGTEYTTTSNEGTEYTTTSDEDSEYATTKGGE